MRNKTLQLLLKEFFVDWLSKERNVTPNTIRSYRDSLMLFLTYVATEIRQPIQTLSFTDLNAKAVLRFLDHCERKRKCKITTRNCRLAAVKSFMKFTSRNEPTLHDQCKEVLSLVTKKFSKPARTSLTQAEVESILNQPATTTPIGLRDTVLLNLLFHTGVRVQEALDLRPCDVRLSPSPQITVNGKGRKQRVLPLTKVCGKLFGRLMSECPCEPDAKVFRNNRGDPLSQSGVRDKLRKYTSQAASDISSLQGRRVSPHLLRHTFASHMLDAGVDIATIGNFLGHESVTTTYIYLQSNLEAKRKALTAGADKTDSRRLSPTRVEPSILSWLKSL